MNYSLSGGDVVKLVKATTGVEPNLITYKELDKYKNVRDIMKNGMCVILYESLEGYGHWTCVFVDPKDGKTIEHFDSYGLFPDKELKFVSKDINKMLGQGYPMLSKLLYEYPYDVRYSHGKFQGKESSTCGRWCGLRLWFREVDEYVFKKLFGKIGDSGVVELTNAILS